MKRIITLSLFIMATVLGYSQAQLPADMEEKLSGYARAIENFGNALPQEKVYLHFDNTSYYQGDNIWFQSYIVTSGFNRPAELSRTLYVELLNPGGEIVAKRVLPIENGRSHGDFQLTHLPFYSGFYEVRAYTKYMLNFGEDVIFSRIFPVFEKPGTEGNYEEKKINTTDVRKYPQKRGRTSTGKKVNLNFFPEGGNLVQGVPSRVAFEATDEYGNPLELTGTVVDREKKDITRLTTTHDGRGVFSYTPSGQGDRAMVTIDGKEYGFDMPESLPQGFTLHVDNLSSEDSITVTVRRSPGTPVNVLGVVLMGQGKLFNYNMLDMSSHEAVRFKLDKTALPGGVANVVLFDEAGRIIADRLIFNHNAELVTISVAKDKENYAPFDLVGLNISARNAAGEPVQAPLSVSVRDGNEEVEGRHSILTDLLLMSEIKGYVRRPGYYFESDDLMRRIALDQLLMVQGWRRYSWEQWAGPWPVELEYEPEDGVAIHGQVVSMARSKPQPGVQISALLQAENAETTDQMFYTSLDTDSTGRFAFIYDHYGRWHATLTVTNKGKPTNHRIVLDRTFSPDPVKYPIAEMQISIAETGMIGLSPDTGIPPDSVVTEGTDFNRIVGVYEDSLSGTGIFDKALRLDEAVVGAKRPTRVKDIITNRAKSVAYYDVASVMDDISDNDDFIGGDIHDLIMKMNPDFMRRVFRDGDGIPTETIIYKGAMPLYVINYEPMPFLESDSEKSRWKNKYKLLTVESIKSIYVSEDKVSLHIYADPTATPDSIDKIYSCVVFIETYPDGQIPVEPAKGVRKTWFQGYNEPREFYQPDYSSFAPEVDYRRTLYWNPSLVTDENGDASVSFYNNSRARRFRVNVETVSATGAIGAFGE